MTPHHFWGYPFLVTEMVYVPNRTKLVTKANNPKKGLHWHHKFHLACTCKTLGINSVVLEDPIVPESRGVKVGEGRGVTRSRRRWGGLCPFSQPQSSKTKVSRFPICNLAIYSETFLLYNSCLSCLSRRVLFVDLCTLPVAISTAFELRNYPDKILKSLSVSRSRPLDSFLTCLGRMHARTHGCGLRRPDTQTPTR